MKLYSINNFIYRNIYLASIIFALATHKSTAQQNQAFPAEVNGNFPVTNLLFNDDSSKVQFAIVSDLWGDYRPGIFEDAVSKLELLQPQFVMSVGDLINGKIYDSVLVNKEWNEFNKKLQPLTMPFFYVPGNHGIANPMMERQWKARFGRAYYYFVYKNVLFLCVNTQDGGHSIIGDDQAAYFRKAIEDNPNVRWTFIFMHRPVWFTDNNNEEGLEKIESAFKGNHYTLFCGHYHTYLKINKKGYKHFILGTTGGGSDLRGEKFGEYDHITWVTLNKEDTPKIINLKLSGLIKEDVVNEKTYPITNTLINEDWLITPSYVLPDKLEKAISPKIIFNNPTPYPLKVTGDLPEMTGYNIRPQKIDLTIPANTKKEQTLSITPTNDSAIDISALPFIEVALNGAYQYDTVHYELPAKKQLSLNWKHRLPEIQDAKILVRQLFERGDTSSFISIIHPEYLKNKWYWSGPDDGLISFKLIHDAKYLYLAALIKDDQLVLDKKTDQRDIIYVDFEDKNGTPAEFNIYPDPEKSAISEKKSAAILNVKDIKMESAVNANEIKILLRIPVNKIIKADHSFRFNIGYRDQDNYPESHNSSVFWKPVWGTETDYQNSGTFILVNKN